MKRIDFGDIGNIAEAVAAIGVIVSLIYLGVQIIKTPTPFGLPVIRVSPMISRIFRWVWPKMQS